MVTANHNLIANIWRQEKQDDDPIGGAVYSGTLAYEALPVSIAANRPAQASLDQGLETPATYDLTCQAKQMGRVILLIEKDVVEITGPPDTPYLGFEYRILGVQPSKHRPRYTRQHATIRRTRETRRESW